MEPIKYAGQSTAGPSMGLWNDCPWGSIMSGREPGFAMEDDFHHLDIGATATSNSKWYGIYLDTGVTIAKVDSILGGVVRLATSATDNDQVIMGSHVVGGSFNFVTNSGGKIWYECRVLTSAITASSMAIGFINAADIATDLLADSQTDTAMLDTSAPDFVGFIQAGDSTAAGLDAAYMDQSTTGGHSILKADAQTLVADTWYKLGIYFDGGTIVRYFIDGVQVGANLSPAADEFPNGEELGLVFAAKAGGSVDKQIDIDWVRAAQLRV